MSLNFSILECEVDFELLMTTVFGMVKIFLILLRIFAVTKFF